MRRKLKSSNKYLLTATVLVVGLLAYGIIRHFFIKKVDYIPSTKIVSSNTTKTAGPGTNTTQNNTAIDSTSPKETAPSPSGGQGSSAGFLAPSGSFVSNHKPSLSGSTAPSQEISTCNTSPGAQCYIEFDQDNLVKKLDVQTADSSGSVNWKWDVAKAGFSEGSWQIKAVSTLNGQTKTTNDSFAFEVQP